VVIPAGIRRELAIEDGTELIALAAEGGVLLLPRSEVKKRLRTMFAGIKTSLADELLADRRREALRKDRGG
jgi:bifunctional DNA-binding transcriptional regulator/antitoxin component of YhaV-PrlF toxin-antitoxin module